MTTIKYFAVHHAGGLGNNIHASTQDLTLEHVNNAHQRRWPRFKSELGFWVGYNAIIFPTGKLIQTRLIGEETAAQKFHNKDTFSVLVMGNHTKQFFGGLVDTPTREAIATLQEVGTALLNKDPEFVGLKMKAGTVLDIKLKDVVPHRVLQWSACYGNGLANSWARNLVKAWYNRKREEGPTPAEILYLQQQLMQIQIILFDLIRQWKAIMSGQAFGSRASISCIENEDVFG